MRPKTRRFTLGGTGAAAIAIAALIVATTGSEATSSGSMTTARRAEATPTGPVTTAQIKALVMSDAAGMGDSSPTDISYSAPVTRNAANAASGDGAIIGGADGTAGGYILVVAHGHFTGYNAMTPPGDNNYPTGTVMIMVVNATTGEVTDAGLQNRTPDMSAIGPVTAVPAG